MHKRLGDGFHNRHELLTEKIYRTPGMLPHRYVFILTNHCNLRCDFCYQHKKPHKDKMAVEDWFNLAWQLPDYARVTLTGGEPLLFQGFREVFASIAERFACNLITNGILLDEEWIDFLLSFPNFKVLSISIDNIGNTIRGLKPAQWKHLQRMMRHFVNRRDKQGSDCVLDVKTLILDENADQLLAIHRYCVEHLRCDHHAFQFLKGSPIQHADEMRPWTNMLDRSRAYVYQKFEIIKQELERVRRYNVSHGKVAFLHPKLASLTSPGPLPDLDYINEAKYVPDNFEPCKFPWSSVHINSDGHLFPCLAISMGNVKETSLSDIVTGELFACFRELILKNGSVEGCNRCGWLRPRV